MYITLLTASRHLSYLTTTKFISTDPAPPLHLQKHSTSGGISSQQPKALTIFNQNNHLHTSTLRNLSTLIYKDTHEYQHCSSTAGRCERARPLVFHRELQQVTAKRQRYVLSVTISCWIAIISHMYDYTIFVYCFMLSRVVLKMSERYNRFLLYKLMYPYVT